MEFVFWCELVEVLRASLIQAGTVSVAMCLRKEPSVLKIGPLAAKKFNFKEAKQRWKTMHFHNVRVAYNFF
jgi:hypothetical protein